MDQLKIVVVPSLEFDSEEVVRHCRSVTTLYYDSSFNTDILPPTLRETLTLVPLISFRSQSESVDLIKDSFDGEAFIAHLRSISDQPHGVILAKERAFTLLPLLIAEEVSYKYCSISAKNMQSTRSQPVRGKRAKALMIQGTSSDAGKSLMTAAFCRILKQEGIRVAPFKAQNMSNNAAVTFDGGEIGRAQAYQATACGLECDVRMNPLLIKPHAGGAQTILMGKVAGILSPKDYLTDRAESRRVILDAYDSLADEYDVIVLEGAGSPAEVNLRKYDIVNMAMAHHADASVLLVGDIDRGGIFASFIGTCECLSPLDNARIKGFLVNKFRGDPSLLRDGYRFLENRTGIPVLGTIPFTHDLHIPDEDAVSLRLRRAGPSTARPDQLDIALLDIPAIANHSDFDLLEQEGDVALRLVRDVRDLGTPDAVIIPGSKSVLSDYASLEKRGFVEALRGLKAKGISEIVGICGGMQMLGNRITDGGVECGAVCSALGFLSIETVFESEKIVRRSRITHCESRTIAEGYEIHHGRTTGSASVSFVGENGESCGYRSEDGMIWGTYLHGVFDEGSFRHWWLERLRKSKGIVSRVPSQLVTLDTALDRLADVVRANCDLETVMRMVE